MIRRRLCLRRPRPSAGGSARFRALALAVALALAACAGAPPPAATPFASDAECRPDEPFRDCAYRVEAAALARVEGHAWRSGDTLVLALADGTLGLVSDTTEGDAYIVHRYEERLARERQHLVAYHLYEGGGYVLVDERGGGPSYLAARPVVSPRRTRFAVAHADLWAGYERNVVQVWRFTDGAAELEWEMDGGDDWGAAGAVWRGETVLDFDRVERADDGMTERRTPVRLRIDGRRFELRPREEAAP